MTRVGYGDLLKVPTLRSGGGAAAVTWLLRATFGGGDQSAPLTSPLGAPAVEIGNLTIADVGNILSIASDQLVASGTVGATATTMHSDYERVAGRALTIDVPTRTTVTAVPRVGIGPQNAANLSPGIWYTGVNAVSPVDNETAIYSYPLTGSHQLLFVAQTTGGYALAKTTTDAQYRLLWRNNAASAGIRAKQYFFPTLAVNMRFDSWGVRDLGGNWGKDFGIATDYTAWPASDDTLTTQADMLLEFTWVPVAAETLTILFRRTDDDNTLKLVCDQAGGTIKLYDRQAGSDTEFDPGKTQTFTAGTTYRIVIIASGSNVRTFVNVTAKNNATITYNQTVTGAKVRGFTSAKGSNFAAFPLLIDDPLSAPAGLSPRRIFAYGDSYTYGTGDDTPPAAGQGGYQPILIASLVASTNRGWSEVPSRVGKGGYTAAALKADVDADLAARNGVTPDYILVDVGQNDLASMPTKAAWVANVGYILDAMHTKWPTAQIYVARVYSAGYPAETATIDDDWIPTVLSTRTGWASLGIDRRTVLNSPGDLDGSEHPTRQGYTKMAAAWKVVLGL